MQTNQNQSIVDELADEWLMKKAELEAIKTELILIENRLLPHVEQRDEGQATTKTDRHTIVCRLSTNYSLNGTKLLKVKDQIPEQMLPLSVKTVLDPKRLRYLRQNEPSTYAVFALALTARPAKPNFKISETENTTDGV